MMRIGQFLLALIARPLFVMNTEPTNATEVGASETCWTEAEEHVGKKFSDWVATLSPERKAWEAMLQRRLGTTFGGYYLPIYKREKVQGVVSAWDYVEDDPGLPRVLLIGDSISRGYTLPVRAAMIGKAGIHRAPENCGATTSGVAHLGEWLGDGNWDVIHFNFGLHDAITPARVYERQLREIVARLKRIRTQLVWASTTPRPVDEKGGAAMVAADAERRSIAARIMRDNQIPVNDLFRAIEPHLVTMQNAKDVHFNDLGYEFLGETVARSIEVALASRGSSVRHPIPDRQIF